MKNTFLRSMNLRLTTTLDSSFFWAQSLHSCAPRVKLGRIYLHINSLLPPFWLIYVTHFISLHTPFAHSLCSSQMHAIISKLASKPSQLFILNCEWHVWFQQAFHLFFTRCYHNSFLCTPLQLLSQLILPLPLPCYCYCFLLNSNCLYHYYDYHI